MECNRETKGVNCVSHPPLVSAPSVHAGHVRNLQPFANLLTCFAVKTTRHHARDLRIPAGEDCISRLRYCAGPVSSEICCSSYRVM